MVPNRHNQLHVMLVLHHLKRRPTRAVLAMNKIINGTVNDRIRLIKISKYKGTCDEIRSLWAQMI